VDEYFKNNMNGTEAYCVVYGVNRTVGATNASNLLRNPKIQDEISRRLKEKAMGKDEIIARLAEMARSSLLPFIRIKDDGAVFFDFSHPDAKEHMYLIKKIKTKRSRRVVGRGEDAEEWEDEWVEVELHDSQAALEKIGKYHRMFTDQLEVTGKDGGDVIIKVVYEDKQSA
jgi:hypothetical protein